MTDDDKMPVDTKWCRHCRSNAHKTAQCLADHSPDRPAPCGAPIRDRSGRDLGYACNLTKGHLPKCTQVAVVHWLTRSTKDPATFRDISEEYVKMCGEPPGGFVTGDIDQVTCPACKPFFLVPSAK